MLLRGPAPDLWPFVVVRLCCIVSTDRCEFTWGKMPFDMFCAEIVVCAPPPAHTPDVAAENYYARSLLLGFFCVYIT